MITNIKWPLQYTKFYNTVCDKDVHKYDDTLRFTDATKCVRKNPKEEIKDTSDKEMSEMTVINLPLLALLL